MSGHLRVGLYLHPQKLGKLGWGTPAEITTSAAAAGIDAVFLDLSAPLADAPALDAVVAKVTEHLARGPADAEACAAVANLEAYAAAHTRVALLDPVDVQRRFLDREGLCDAHERAAASLSSARQPRHVAAVGARAAAEAVACAGLRYPLLVKPGVACGADAAHVMALAASPAALAEAVEVAGGAAVVAQEYISHGARIYKVFAVGCRDGDVAVQRRASLPDVAPGWQGARALRLENHRPLAPQVAEWCAEMGCAAPAEGAVADPERGELLAAARAVARETGAALFGVDVIADTRDGALALIDANFFPSYRGCLTATQFFEAVARELRSRLDPCGQQQ